MRLRALKGRAIAFEVIVFLVALFAAGVSLLAWGVGTSRAAETEPVFPAPIRAQLWLIDNAHQSRMRIIGTGVGGVARLHIWIVPNDGTAPECFVLYTRKTIAQLPKVSGFPATSYGLSDFEGGVPSGVRTENACWAYR